MFSKQARQRPCSFYKDGSLELDQQGHAGQQTETDQAAETLDNLDISSKEEVSTTVAQQNNVTLETTDEEDDNRILFADTTAANHNKLKRRGPLMESRISNTLGTLGENMRRIAIGDNDSLAGKLLNSTDPFGDFIMWMPEPSLPSRYYGSIEMPTREIQMTLVDQFFNERYESIGLIPRFYFYEQLESKGLMITPLLLNIIYAHASRFVSIPGCPKTEVFYQRARRLVDDFMDVPRVSTVVALCLLSLYEPSPAIYRPGSYHCRQWQYSGMACRMALELGLYDDSNVHGSLNPVEIETRRRVFWGCYELDKFHSGGWERPWMVSHSFIRTLAPSPLPEETEDDRFIVDVSIYRVRFMSIMEEGLALVCASQSFQTGASRPFLGIREDEIPANIAENRARYQQWLRSLPTEMQWPPITSMSVNDVLDLPAPRPMLAHLQLYYHMVGLELLISMPCNSGIQFQTRVTAACMTQLVYHLCQVPSSITKFDFLAHGLIAAIKIHLQYLDDADIILAQQAWLLFDRSMWCMQLINSYAVIPNCTKFLHHIQNIYDLNSSVPSNSKKNTSKVGGRTSQSKRPRESTSGNIHLTNQQNVSPRITCQHQTQPVPLIEDINRRTDRNGPSGIDASLSTSSTVQFANDVNHSIPTYLTEWAPAAPPHNLDQQEQQQHQNSNANQSIVYLDQHYSFPNTHHRSTSPNFHPPLYKQHEIHKSNININASAHLWNHHQRHQSTNNIGFDQRYNMANTIEYKQTNVNNRNDNNNLLEYNTNEIVVPSQLMVDEPTNTALYQTSSPSLQQRQSITNNSSSSSTTRNYAQQLPSSNNMVWQDHTASMDSSSSTDQNMNMTGKNYKSKA